MSNNVDTYGMCDSLLDDAGNEYLIGVRKNGDELDLLLFVLKI